MKIGKYPGLAGITGAFCLMLVLFGCDGCKSKSAVDPFAELNFNAYDQQLGNRVEAYNYAVTQDSANAKSGNPALYIDFSSGIYKAFADPAIKAMMTNCFNTVLAEQFDVYKLGSNEIKPLNISNTTELGQQVSDPAQYVDIWAPIQSAVEKIVEGNNDALLITDFEEWQKNIEVTNTAFLKIPFSKWMQKGNTIHFFIADYKEGAVNKHLYFTIFSCGNPTEASMISKLESKLAPFTTRFDLSTKAYQLHTEYAGVKSGGVFYDASGKSDKAKNVLDLKDNYVNGMKNGSHFEFYPLGLDWKTIGQLQDTYKSQGQFKDFFRNLFIDLSNNDSYIAGDFDVKVSDITADFENFAKSAEAKKHQPKLTKGSDGEAKFAENETDAIALACYNTDGKLKEQWIFKPGTVTPLNEIFVLNKPLFTNTRKTNEKHTELGVSFDPKFDVKNVQNPAGLVKVDILLATATPNLTNVKLSKLQWVNLKGVPNIALYESVRNTIQERKPSNQVIYSYYIKTEQ
jgi:hypothetical protein